MDVLVNNAGFGILGAVEDLTVNEVKKQFETTFFRFTVSHNKFCPP